MSRSDKGVRSVRETKCIGYCELKALGGGRGRATDESMGGRLQSRGYFIRRAAHAISVPSIRMRMLRATGLPKNPPQDSDSCKAPAATETCHGE